jgi:hypothetical protein
MNQKELKQFLYQKEGCDIFRRFDIVLIKLYNSTKIKKINADLMLDALAESFRAGYFGYNNAK